MGLLPDIGAAFAVSDSVTGLLVSLYAVMVAALAVPLTVATSRFARKPLLLTTLARLCVEQRTGGRRTGVRRCRRRPNGRRGDARPVLLVVDRIRTTPGVARTRRSRTRTRRRRRLGRFGSRRAVVDVAGYRGRMAAVIRGSGCAVNAHVRSCRQVAAAREPRTLAGAGSARGGRRPLAAIAASNTLVFLGQFTLYTFVTVLLLASGVSAAFVGPVLLACGACGLSVFGMSAEALTETRDEPPSSYWPWS